MVNNMTNKVILKGYYTCPSCRERFELDEKIEISDTSDTIINASQMYDYDIDCPKCGNCFYIEMESRDC